jgi:hypothetical protein
MSRYDIDDRKSCEESDPLPLTNLVLIVVLS